MKIGFVIFPNVTQLDFTGPLQILNSMPGAETCIIAKTMDAVPSDCGLGLVPTHTFETAPKLNMICVPGGFGTTAAIEDAETLAYVRRTGEAADYVTSVCTGALILGAAGLLDGKKATTHWAYTDLLEACGAIYTQGRVVRDGNTITGGGVTAGIDFALIMVSELCSPAVAESLQLGFEYDPNPPTSTGHPVKAPSALVDAMRRRYAEPTGSARRAIEAARAS